jgi:hypothetical protein
MKAAYHHQRLMKKKRSITISEEAENKWNLI